MSKAIHKPPRKRTSGIASLQRIFSRHKASHLLNSSSLTPTSPRSSLAQTPKVSGESPILVSDVYKRKDFSTRETPECQIENVRVRLQVLRLSPNNSFDRHFPIPTRPPPPPPQSPTRVQDKSQRLSVSRGSSNGTHCSESRGHRTSRRPARCRTRWPILSPLRRSPLVP